MAAETLDLRAAMAVSGMGHSPTEFLSSLESSVGCGSVSFQCYEVERGSVRYGEGGVLADVRQGVSHGGDVDGAGAVPVEEAIFRGKSRGVKTLDKKYGEGRRGSLGLRAVEVVLVQDEGAGEDVAQETGQCGLATGRAARDGDDQSHLLLHDGKERCLNAGEEKVEV